MSIYFITGASSGLGKALAELILSIGGSQVVGLSRTQTIRHADYQHIAIDLAEPDAVAGLNFEQWLGDGGSAVYLVNNAAKVGPVGPVGTLGAGEIQRHIALNLTAPILLVNKLMAIRGNRRFGIVNISSGAATSAIDGWGLYCATKAALQMHTAVTEAERKLSGQDVRAIAVSPGIIDTPMQQEIRSATQQAFSRIADFRAYKADGRLQSPASTAAKLLAAIHAMFTHTEVAVRL